MVTHKYVNGVARNRYIKHQAKIVESRAKLHIIANSDGALVIWIIKQINTNIANQTNNVSK